VRVTAVAVRDSLLRSSSLIMKRNRKLRKIRKRNEKKAGHGVRYRFAACKTLPFGHFCGELPKTPRKSPFFEKKRGVCYIYIYIYIKPLYIYIQKKNPKKFRACPGLPSRLPPGYPKNYCQSTKYFGDSRWGGTEPQHKKIHL